MQNFRPGFNKERIHSEKLCECTHWISGIGICLPNSLAVLGAV